MESQGKLFRLRAIACEQRAATSSDADVKREWSELANQWHALASAHEASSTGESDIDFA